MKWLSAVLSFWERVTKYWRSNGEVKVKKKDAPHIGDEHLGVDDLGYEWARWQKERSKSHAQEPQQQLPQSHSQPAEAASPQTAQGPSALPAPPPAEPQDEVNKDEVKAEPGPSPAAVMNRHERRKLAKWEKERRKLDVFVTPKPADVVPIKKPKPDKPPRPPAEPPPQPLPAAVEITGIPPVEMVPMANKVFMDGEVGYLEEELYGQFGFRDTILEQLELYWTYLRRMQQRDREAYDFYRQVGATVLPPFAHFLHKPPHSPDDREVGARAHDPIELTPWWKANRPSFGCVTYGLTKTVEQAESTVYENKKRLWIPKFMYFIKYHRPPPNVAPRSGGDTYKLTVWWDKPFDPKYNFKKGGIPTDYVVHLNDHTIEALPMLDTDWIATRRKKSSHGYKKGRMFYIPQRAWKIPECYNDWAEQNKEDPNHFLARLFMDAARHYEESNWGMVRIAVHNGDLTAQFSVDPTRMSYFFQDRDVVYTPNGGREKCFHVVRAHQRVTKTGNVANVHLHFRGAKEFTWAGYKVTITVPGKDHFMLPDMDLGVDDSYWVGKKEPAYGMGEFGTKIAKAIAGVPLKQAFEDELHDAT